MKVKVLSLHRSTLRVALSYVAQWVDDRVYDATGYDPALALRLMMRRAPTIEIPDMRH